MMGRTFQSRSWVRVGSDGEDGDNVDDAGDDDDADDDDGTVEEEDDTDDDDDDDDCEHGGGLEVKWRYLQMAMKRSLVIRSADGHQSVTTNTSALELAA